MVICCLAFVLLSVFISCTSPDKKATPGEGEKIDLKEEAVQYATDTVSMDGYVVWNNAIEGKRPVVLVIHEWWGNNDYPKERAKMLAELGYLAMAVDLYGNGKTVDDPEKAGALAMPFYQHPEMVRRRFEAALEKIKSYPQADTSRIAAIGYCFGGAQVINLAKMGFDLDGVVSFHGNLNVIPPQQGIMKTPILVLHGEADEFVSKEELEQFKREMDSVNAQYTIKTYPGATHAFTNPAATATGQKYHMPISYNQKADSLSWLEMKDFLKKIF